jgi:hypothetical protein
LPKEWWAASHRSENRAAGSTTALDERSSAPDAVVAAKVATIGIVAKQRPAPDECADKRDRQLARLILRASSPMNRRNVAEALASCEAAPAMKAIASECAVSARCRTLGVPSEMRVVR